MINNHNQKLKNIEQAAIVNLVEFFNKKENISLIYDTVKSAINENTGNIFSTIEESFKILEKASIGYSIIIHRSKEQIINFHEDQEIFFKDFKNPKTDILKIFDFILKKDYDSDFEKNFLDKNFLTEIKNTFIYGKKCQNRSKKRKEIEISFSGKVFVDGFCIISWTVYWKLKTSKIPDLSIKSIGFTC